MPRALICYNGSDMPQKLTPFDPGLDGRDDPDAAFENLDRWLDDALSRFFKSRGCTPAQASDGRWFDLLMANQDDRSYETDLRGFGRTFPHRYGDVGNKLLYNLRVVVGSKSPQSLLRFSPNAARRPLRVV